jgi:hypothetical protein
MSPSVVYIAIFVLSTSGGLTVEAEGDCFQTYDQCMMDSEAEAKSMALEWRQGGARRSFFKSVSVRCDGMTLEQAKKEDRHVVRSR